MLSELKELYRFRELLLTMVQRELKIRYKNSKLGFLWSLLNPLITVFVMSFVWQFMNDGMVPSMTAYLLAAYLPFTFYQLCLMDSAQTILISMPLIKKIYFPREILPLASVLGNFVHFLMALVMFFALGSITLPVPKFLDAVNADPGNVSGVAELIFGKYVCFGSIFTMNPLGHGPENLRRNSSSCSNLGPIRITGMSYAANSGSQFGIPRPVSMSQPTYRPPK